MQQLKCMENSKWIWSIGWIPVTCIPHGWKGLLVAINNIFGAKQKSCWLYIGTTDECEIFRNIVHWTIIFSTGFFFDFIEIENEGKKEPINFMINYHLLCHRKMPSEWTIERAKSYVSSRNFWPASCCASGIQPFMM